MNKKEKTALITRPWTYRQDGNLGEVMQRLPFPLEVLDGTHKHNVLELVVVKVAGTEWHHQVPKANQGRTDIAKDADHHVAAQDGHGSFTSGLPREKSTSIGTEDPTGLWKGREHHFCKIASKQSRSAYYVLLLFIPSMLYSCHVLITHSCLTLCNPMD